MKQRGELVLGSGSPRRREILATLGLVYRVEVAGTDETVRQGEAPRAYVARVAREKADAVLGRFAPGTVAERGAPEAPAEGWCVLTADTSVVLGDSILGKPEDDADALRMMSALAGRAHTVMTAVCALSDTGRRAERLVETEVRMRAADPAALARYVATGEGRDKAGAYAVQGIGAGFVSEVRGSYLNVVGLPAVETLDALAEVGALLEWP